MHLKLYPVRMTCWYRPVRAFPRVDDYNYIPKPKVTPPVDEGIWGSPWGAKGGGIAKRGMGAAFKSGGHVKSMGIAKRGGGAAKR